MRAKVNIFAAIAAAFMLGALSSCAPRPETLSFAPPFPEMNANGDPILADYVGRIPCAVAGCDRLKVELVLYRDRATGAPTTYWLGLIGAAGDDRVVTQGAWTVRRGVTGYPDATAYQLDEAAPADMRHYWRVNEDILLVLDESFTPRVGNGAWGYMLGRLTEPYGPRTYRMKGGS